MNKNLPYDFDYGTSFPGIRKAGRPFSLVHAEKSDRAVLCIHGYTGYPGELVRPAEDLYEAGFDVFVPRLPGHGTNGKDFASSRAANWIGEAEKALSELLSRYSSVDLVGHSMGGAIVAILLSRHPEVRKAVLACPAVCTSIVPEDTRKKLKFISLFQKRTRVQWHSDPSYNLHYEDALGDDGHYGAEYWSWQYTRQLLELSRLMDEATSSLEKVTTPVLLITAGKDAIITPDAGEKVEGILSGRVRRVHVEEATHYIYYDKYPEAEETAVGKTVEFLVE